jgi:hypothetical protein
VAGGAGEHQVHFVSPDFSLASSGPLRVSTCPQNSLLCSLHL